MDMYYLILLDFNIYQIILINGNNSRTKNGHQNLKRINNACRMINIWI